MIRALSARQAGPSKESASVRDGLAGGDARIGDRPVMLETTSCSIFIASITAAVDPRAHRLVHGEGDCPTTVPANGANRVI